MTCTFAGGGGGGGLGLQPAAKRVNTPVPKRTIFFVMLKRPLSAGELTIMEERLFSSLVTATS